MKPETIKIDEVEYVRADSVKTVKYEPGPDGLWEKGKPYFIRTVTMALHGVLVAVTPLELGIIKAAWIADTGRFHDFVCGKIDPSEIEPFPQDEMVIVGRGALIDAVQRTGQFKVQK